MKHSHIKSVIIAALAGVAFATFALVAKPGAPARVSMSPSPKATTSAEPTPLPETTPQRTPSPSTQAKITWSPTSVEVVLSPGETTTRTITFTSSLALHNVHLKLKKD